MTKKILIGISLLLVTVGHAQDGFVRLIKLPHGAASTRTPCFAADMDHDGLMEFGMWCQDENSVFEGWQIWKCIPPDSFVLSKQGQRTYPEDPTLPGNLVAWDACDVDGDGLTELVGVTYGGSPNYELFVQTVESEDYYDYPSKVNWMNVYGTGAYFSTPFYLTDLDQDGKTEILFTAFGGGTAVIYENVANDSNRMVWSDTAKDTPYNMTLRSWVWGDFDDDGKVEFASGDLFGYYVVWEHTGEDNDYQRVHKGPVEDEEATSLDVFGGQDMDGDGYPEFFFNVHWGMGLGDMELWRYYAVGDNEYECERVDTCRNARVGGILKSDVGDVDGDGLLEVVWCQGWRIWLLDDAEHGYQRLGEYWPDHYGNSDHMLITCADLTLDGSDEIIVTGCFRTSILKWQGVGVEEGPESEDMNLWTSITPGGTEIHYSLSSPSSVNINIYDCSGRMVGDYELESNAGDNVFVLSESVVNPGVYFIRITTSTNSTTCKTIQIR